MKKEVHSLASHVGPFWLQAPHVFAMTIPFNIMKLLFRFKGPVDETGEWRPGSTVLDAIQEAVDQMEKIGKDVKDERTRLSSTSEWLHGGTDKDEIIRRR